MGKTYDVEMITDFLEHLQWELRIRHFENTRKVGTDHSELSEQLANCIRKRNTKALLYTNRVDNSGLTADQTQEAINVIREGLATEAQEALDAFDVLEEILEEALICASHPETPLARSINLREFLRSMEEQEEQEDEES
ncbi:MAG: hypothetical protein ACYS74_01625 [Planctomycetota bacterium]|jgi:hypothetical protein